MQLLIEQNDYHIMVIISYIQLIIALHQPVSNDNTSYNTLYNVYNYVANITYHILHSAKSFLPKFYTLKMFSYCVINVLVNIKQQYFARQPLRYTF